MNLAKHFPENVPGQALFGKTYVAKRFPEKHVSVRNKPENMFRCEPYRKQFRWKTGRRVSVRNKPEKRFR